MPIRITCPACQMTASVDDKVRGKRIRCPKCKEAFSADPIADRDDSEREERTQPNRRPAAKPPAPAPRRPRDEDDEAPAARPPSRLRKPIEEEEAPRRRPMRDRDDEDDKPSRRKKQVKAAPRPPS